MIDTIPNFEIPVQEFILTKEMLESGKNVYIPKGVNITDEALVVAVERGIIKPTEEQLKRIEAYLADKQLKESPDYILKKLGISESEMKILIKKIGG